MQLKYIKFQFEVVEMPGLIALIIIICFVVYLVISKNTDKNNAMEIMKNYCNDEKIVKSVMANVFSCAKSYRGLLTLTDTALYFLSESKAKKYELVFKLRYEEILSHKLYIKIFIEDSNHIIYEINSDNNAVLYQQLSKFLANVSEM